MEDIRTDPGPAGPASVHLKEPTVIDREKVKMHLPLKRHAISLWLFFPPLFTKQNVLTNTNSLFL